MPPLRFSLGFLIRQVTLLCVILAAISYLIWLNTRGAPWEQAAIVFLATALCSAAGAFIGGFWGMGSSGGVAGAIAGMFLAVLILADAVHYVH